MSYNKDVLIKLLNEIYKDTHTDVNFDPDKNMKYLGGGGTKISFGGQDRKFEAIIPEEEGPSLSILEDGVNAFHNFINEMMEDDDFKQHISPKAIESVLTKVLRKTQGKLPETDINEFLKSEIIKPLRAEIRLWVVYIPLSNIIITKSLKVGDTLFMPNIAIQSELKGLFHEHEYGGDKNKQKEQKELTEDLLNKHFYIHPAYMKVNVRAHATMAQQKATEVAHTAINAIRAFTHTLYTHSMRSFFGLPNEIQTGNWLTVSYGNDQKRGFHVDFNKCHALMQFSLNEKNINLLNENCSFQTIQQIFSTQPADRKEIDTIIIQALQVLGNSVVAPTVDMKFLNCTIALERMLIAPHEDATIERFSDRLALSLSKNPVQRLKVKDKAKELYDKRSKIVHAAFLGIEEDEYFLFEDWAIGLVLELIKKRSKYKSHSEFCKKIDELKFGLDN